VKGGEAATLVERCLACKADGAGLCNLLNALDVPVFPICINLYLALHSLARRRVHLRLLFLFSRPFEVLFCVPSHLGKGVMEIWSVGVAKVRGATCKVSQDLAGHKFGFREPNAPLFPRLHHSDPLLGLRFVPALG
jgi:hypothetical protein